VPRANRTTRSVGPKADAGYGYRYLHDSFDLEALAVKLQTSFRPGTATVQSACCDHVLDRPVSLHRPPRTQGNIIGAVSMRKSADARQRASRLAATHRMGSPNNGLLCRPTCSCSRQHRYFAESGVSRRPRDDYRPRIEKRLDGLASRNGNRRVSYRMEFSGLLQGAG